MRDFRLKALEHFRERPMPNWGGNLGEIDFENIFYYIRPTEKQGKTWDEVPADIKNTFEKLGIPEAERKFLAGVGAQYESEVIYHSLREDLEKQGVIFLDMDSGLREHPELVKQYFGTIIPPNDNKFAALNSAVWSGGSFIYVPPGREDRGAAAGLLPHQRREHGPVRADADHRRRGRLRALRRGLHRADLHDRLAALGGGRDHRQGGRPLPLHDDPELVEERLQPRHQARRRLQGRDDGVGRRQPRLEADDEVPGRLADGRGRARRDALGRLRGRGPAPGRGRQGRPRRAAHVVPDHLEVDLARTAGAAGYRGLLKVAKGARGAKSNVVCDALLLDEESRSDTYPYIEVEETENVFIGHEATVSKVGEEQIFYLMSRGLSEDEASA